MYDDGNWENDYTSEASWSSDNHSIMTVSTGMVTGHSVGTANIQDQREKSDRCGRFAAHHIIVRQ